MYERTINETTVNETALYQIVNTSPKHLVVYKVCANAQCTNVQWTIEPLMKQFSIQFGVSKVCANAQCTNVQPYNERFHSCRNTRRSPIRREKHEDKWQIPNTLLVSPPRQQGDHVRIPGIKQGQYCAQKVVNPLLEVHMSPLSPGWGKENIGEVCTDWWIIYRNFSYLSPPHPLSIKPPL